MSADILGAVWFAHARVSDRNAMKKFLAPLPAAISTDARKLAGPNGRNKGGMRYDAPTRKAFFLQHGTGGMLTCVTFEHVGDAQTAAKIWEQLDAAAPCNQKEIIEIYARVTGIAIESVGRPS